MALDGRGYSSQDWLEALSALRFSSDQKDALAPVPELCMAETFPPGCRVIVPFFSLSSGSGHVCALVSPDCYISADILP
jgi:hypothetical protein